MAFRVINSLSTKLPPQQVFPVVMENVINYVQSQDPKFRKAGMMAFAVRFRIFLLLIRKF